MKIIHLTKGYRTLVDDEDYERFNQFHWEAVERDNTVYAVRKVSIEGRTKTLFLHREILGLTEPSILTDHRDQDGLDNRKQNLRACNINENNRNQKARKGCSSKYKGVHAVNKKRKWKAEIYIEGKKYNLGVHDNELDAARAYNEKAKELFGEFAWLNRI